MEANFLNFLKNHVTLSTLLIPHPSQNKNKKEFKFALLEPLNNYFFKGFKGVQNAM